MAFAALTAAPGSSADSHAVDRGQTLRLAPAQAGVVTGRTTVTADIRIHGDLAPWTPVTFSLDGLGTLEIVQTQTGSTGRAATIFVPPIGQSGVSTIAAIAVVDGETIVETIEVDFEGLAYYSITEIWNSPGATITTRIGLNNHGAIALGTSIHRAGEPPVNISGMSGVAIDDAGVVYGVTGYNHEDCSYPPGGEAARYSEGAIAHFPGLYGPSRCLYGSTFSGVNSTGMFVVGGSWLPWYHPDVPDQPQSVPHATLWTNGAPVLLHPPSALYSTPNDANDSGVVVGFALDETSGVRPVKWGPGGGASFLGVADATGATAVAVNNFGEAAGDLIGTFLSPGGTRPALWLPASAHGLPPGTHILPVLPGGMASVRGINDEGIVVGYQSPMTHGAASKGWLWSNGETSDLNDLIAPDSLYQIVSALAINDVGQIACGAVLKNDPTDFYYVLLTPEA